MLSGVWGPRVECRERRTSLLPPWHENIVSLVYSDARSIYSRQVNLQSTSKWGLSKMETYCLPISVTKALWRQRRMAGEVYSSREEHVWPQKLRHPEMRTSWFV